MLDAGLIVDREYETLKARIIERDQQAGLGACKALTLLWSAKRRGIRVEGIEVRVERDSTQERAGTYHLDAQLRLGGPLFGSEG